MQWTVVIEAETDIIGDLARIRMSSVGIQVN